MNVTLIGSMPQKDAEVALKKIIENIKIPCWPQLPKRSFKEHMCTQYSENFPGIKIDDNRVIFSEESFYQEIENFFKNYEDKNYDYFKISKDFAEGFYKFLEFLPAIENKDFLSLKLQTTGVVTFALSIKDSYGKPIFYDLQLREVVVKHLVMKSIWQLKEIINNIDSKDNKKVELILFYDEPYLSAYGSAFTSVSREEIISSIVTILKETKELFLKIVNSYNVVNNLDLKIGIHCCGNTDWSILTEIEYLDIISFDAYDFFENFVLYAKDIKSFLENKGIIAWGIIPNNEKIFSVSSKSLIDKLERYIYELTLKGVKKELLYKNLILTPQCGLGNVKENIVVDKVLEICKEISLKEI
ncbi:MAG: hypothetical protein ACK4WJ_04775 [Endomicrobiia bacterium]